LDAALETPGLSFSGVRGSRRCSGYITEGYGGMPDARGEGGAMIRSEVAGLSHFCCDMEERLGTRPSVGGGARVFFVRKGS